MILRPTKCEIQGHRVWLQDAEETDATYVEYHCQYGGVHVSYKEHLPNVKEIDHAEVAQDPNDQPIG